VYLVLIKLAGLLIGWINIFGFDEVVWLAGWLCLNKNFLAGCEWFWLS